MNTDELNRVLYAMACIGDHSEAISAYQALAMLYPQHREAIRAAFERDQCDWWAADTINDCFSADLVPTIEHRYAQWLDAQKGKPLGTSDVLASLIGPDDAAIARGDPEDDPK